MKVLLDAHTVIWALDDPRRLGANATTVLQDTRNELVLGVATMWEMGIKVGVGKLNLSLPFLQWMNRAINDLDLVLWPISLNHVDAQRQLPYHHGDPFDRMLIAQSIFESFPIVSVDRQLDAYSVQRIW